MSKYLEERRNKMLGIKPKKTEEEKPAKTASKQPPIKRQSKKRVVDHREYRKIVKEMMAESNECEIKETGCTVIASGLHHKKKRSPATLLDKRFLIRACDNCNQWVELHPLEAIEKGYSISKHKKESADK